MSRHRASSMINMYGLNYCADHTNGNIYEYSLDILTDNGDPINKQRDTAVIHGGLFGEPDAKLFYDEVEFIIVSGYKDQSGTGMGPQPVQRGICGTFNDLSLGELLNVSANQNVAQTSMALALTPLASGLSFSDTKSVCFTVGFSRLNEPNPGLTVHAIDISSTSPNRSNFAVWMDENGFINIEGRDVTGTEILNVVIKNNNGSFAGGATYLIGCVINLNNVNNREIWLDGTDITRLANYVTWNTYTDAYLSLADTGVSPTDLTYAFGGARTGVIHWCTEGFYNGTGQAGGDDTLGYVSFDDTCSLICAAMWDTNGWVTDPQAWSGWYKSQPQAFFGPTFYKNSGKTARASYSGEGIEALPTDVYIPAGSSHLIQNVLTQVNRGIAGTTEAVR